MAQIDTQTGGIIGAHGTYEAGARCAELTAKGHELIAVFKVPGTWTHRVLYGLSYREQFADMERVEHLPCTYERTPGETEVYALELTDQKGRTMSTAVHMGEMKIAPKEEQRWGYVAEPHEFGSYHTYRLQARRDGKPFGPAGREMRYRETDERNTAADKARLKAGKAAATKFA